MASTTPDFSALENIPAYEEADAIKDRLVKQREEIEAKKAAKESRNDDDPRRKEEYIFDFEWKDGWGKSFRGRFKNRILSMADQSLLGAMQSEYALGKPYSSLDPLTQEINLMVAWLTISVTNLNEVEWAKDWRQIKNIRLIQAIYKEVMAHEATFHGLQADQEGSETVD